MKANEAPEKLYFENNKGILDIYSNRESNDEVEYVRKDAFVENACKLLVNCIEDFMARRMEIWDKECKKQTLENLRKALNK